MKVNNRYWLPRISLNKIKNVADLSDFPQPKQQSNLASRNFPDESNNFG
jgi:hypothetical protein